MTSRTTAHSLIAPIAALLLTAGPFAAQESEELDLRSPRELWEQEVAEADRLSDRGEHEAAYAVLLGAKGLADELEPEEAAPTLSLLFMGSALGRSGDRERADTMLAEARKLALEVWSDDKATKVWFLCRLSIAYQCGGNPEAAADALATAVACEKKTVGDASPELAPMYARLGALKASYGDQSAARLSFKNAIRLLGDGTVGEPARIRVYQPYALWLEEQGDHQTARHIRAFLEKCDPKEVAATEALHAPRPLRFLPMIDELVHLRWVRARQVAMNNFDNEDASIAEEALLSAHRLGGRLEPDYQYQSIVEMETAYIHTAWGQLDTAELLYEMALTTVSEGYGPESLDVARASMMIARLRYARGQFKESKVDATRALEITKKALGRDTLDLAPICSHLGYVHYRLGELRESLSMFEKNLSIVRAALGQEDPSLIEILGHCTYVARKLGLTRTATRHAERMQWVRDAPKRRHAEFVGMMSAPLERAASAGSASSPNGYGGFGEAAYDAWRAADDFWSDNAGKMGALGYEFR